MSMHGLRSRNQAKERATDAERRLRAITRHVETCVAYHPRNGCPHLPRMLKVAERFCSKQRVNDAVDHGETLRMLNPPPTVEWTTGRLSSSKPALQYPPTANSVKVWSDQSGNGNHFVATDYAGLEARIATTLGFKP